MQSVPLLNLISHNEYVESGGIAPRFLKSNISRSYRSASRLGHFTPVHIGQDGTRRRTGNKKEVLISPQPDPTEKNNRKFAIFRPMRR